MIETGTYDSYIKDYEGNFIMGDMSGYLVKLFEE